MATTATRRLIPHGERTARDGNAPATSDESLLQAFLSGDSEASEAAFHALVSRHGPMVMGVCRQVLNHAEDAEDAFQATFLALARRAETIRDHRHLSSWLYEVAYRIAIRARSTAARRREQEKIGAALAVDSVDPMQEHTAAWAELRPVLHDELNRLPEKYRLPIILSYLEGRTNEEVAGLLSWPVGTVKGRLSRARDLLRSRLVRRGLVLSAAFLVSALSQGVTFAEPVSPSLAHRAARRALRGRRRADAHPAEDPARGAPPEPAAESARIEDLARSAPARRRTHGRFLSWLSHGLAALTILAMLASLFIFTDPGSTRAFKRSVKALVAGGSLRGCH